MTETKHFPWDEGIPTKPDVDALLKQWPPETIKAGEWKITDEQAKPLIGNPNRIRYRTVYAAWIARLKADHSIVLYRSKQLGFYCPTPEEIFSRTHPTLQSAGRKIGAQLKNVGLAKPETEIGKQTQDHHGRLLHAQKRELKKARMNLLPPTSVAETPRISPPSKANR
jgi:hypothetical protein